MALHFFSSFLWGQATWALDLSKHHLLRIQQKPCNSNPLTLTYCLEHLLHFHYPGCKLISETFVKETCWNKVIDRINTVGVKRRDVAWQCTFFFFFFFDEVCHMGTGLVQASPPHSTKASKLQTTNPYPHFQDYPNCKPVFWDIGEVNVLIQKS